MKLFLIILFIILLVTFMCTSEGLLSDYDTGVRYAAVLDEVGRQPRALTQGAESFSPGAGDKEGSGVTQELAEILWAGN